MKRRTQCGTCELVAVRDGVSPTLSPGIVFGECVRCGKPTMQRDMGEPIDDVDAAERLEKIAGPAPVPDPPDRAPLVGTAEPILDGDPPICPDCQLAGRHAPDCAFPGRLHQAYLRWRETAEGSLVVEAIRSRALELRARGFTHYGIKALGEVVRFDHAIAVGPNGGWKVNNSYLSRLSRDLMVEEAALDDFFEVRELRS